MLLVLWDIDGTLVDGAGVGRAIYADAFAAAFGRAADATTVSGLSMNGRTDKEITLDLLLRHRITDPEQHLEAFAGALATALTARDAEIRARGRALPGAEQALDQLGRAPGIVQSVLTGNIEPNARRKLAAFGLDRYVDFTVGGYGSDDHRRAELVEVARRRGAERYGDDFAGARTVLIGDTPLDVLAGLAAGARVVAVATGGFTVDDLRGAGAEAVLADLTDPHAVLDTVLDRQRR